MNKPLAIDLFCGLFQRKFSARAYPTVKNLVTCRAEYPDHVTLRISHGFPSAVTPVLGFVRDLKNATLAACLASQRQIWEPTPEATDHGILERAPRIVDALNARFASHELATQATRRLPPAILRAIAAVSARRRYLKVFIALETVAASLRYVRLLKSSPPPSTTLAGRRAIEPIWANGPECAFALGAKQIVHAESVS